MHRAFSSYDQRTRIGPNLPPSWMPDSTAAELAQRQSALQQYYQQQANPNQPMAAPVAMPMPMPMMMPMPYAYPPPQPGPSTSRHRSPRYYESDTDTEDDHRHRRSPSHSKRRWKAQSSRHHAHRSRRDSSSTESLSSVEVRHSKRKSRRGERRSRRPRTPSSSSVTTDTSSTTSFTATSRSRTSSSASASGTISGTASESDDGSSTVSGHSSGRETTLTTYEMMQASSRAAESVGARRPSTAAALPTATPLPRPKLATPTGQDLFLQIQKAYMKYPLPDHEPKVTLPNIEEAEASDAASIIGVSRPVSAVTTSQPSSAYHTAVQDMNNDTFASRMLPRPSLLQTPASTATKALHPIGADSSSTFNRVGYQPVKSPQLPPEIHISPSSPSLPPSATRSSFDMPDPPVISKSQPSSTRTSPRSALFPPLEYNPPSRASSLKRNKRASLSRANSTVSVRYAPPAPSQIQAAIQHRSVSEAAFPLHEDRLAVPERAYTAASSVGSRMVSDPFLPKCSNILMHFYCRQSATSSANRATRRQVQDSNFDPMALGPNYSDNAHVQHIELGDVSEHYAMPIQAS